MLTVTCQLHTRVRSLFHLLFLSTQLETWQMYKAVQNLTHYNTRNSVTAEVTLCSTMNHLFTRFKVKRLKEATAQLSWCEVHT